VQHAVDVPDRLGRQAAAPVPAPAVQQRPVEGGELRGAEALEGRATQRRDDVGLGVHW
jgi:hypothetical protein